MKILLLLALAALPGLAHAWWNRGLVRRRDEPGLAERMMRLQQWLGVAWVVTLVGLIVAGGAALSPLLGLALLGTLAARWRLRRALFDERWSLPRYVSFIVRLYLAVIGFWIALGAAPSLVALLGERLGWIPAAAVVALALLTWSLAYGKATVALLHARPLDAERRAALEPFLSRVEERSTAVRPALFEIHNPGGHFVNAFAVPDTRAPRVIVSDTLIERFSPDEVGAVYGHETAHLEQFDRRLLLRMGLVVYTLIAVGTVLPGLLEPEARGWLQLGWPIAVVALLLSRMSWLQRHELAADVRAVELCGDAGAVERALIKLHELTLMPRRLPAATEQHISHPSLARRIHALRQATGESGTETTPSPDGLLLVRAAGDGDAAALFEAEGVAWLEGLPGEEATVPAAESPNPEALRRAAAAVHNMPYERLRELDLRAARHGLQLVASDVDGRRHALAVAPEQQAEVQRWLDAVDGRLATAGAGTGVQALPGWQRIGLTVASVFAGLVALLPPTVGAVSLAALVALIRPRPATLTVLGVTGAAGALVRLRQASAHLMGSEAATVFAGLLLLFTLPALIAGWLWKPLARAPRTDFARPLAIIFALATVVSWTALAVIAFADGLDFHRINWLLFWAPSVFMLPLGAAVALFHLPASGRRRAALAAAAIAVALPLVGGSTTVRDLALGDDLRPPRARALRPEARAVLERARRPLGLQGHALRLSPAGDLFAVNAWLERPGDYDIDWHIGTTAGDGTRKLAWALDVRFTGTSALVLSRDENGDGSGAASLVLETFDPTTGGRTPVVTLRDLAAPSLAVGDGGRWQVVGVILRAGGWHGVRIGGQLDAPAIDEQVWDLGTEPDIDLEDQGGEWRDWVDVDPFVAGDGWALAVRPTDREAEPSMSVLVLMEAPFEREIVALGDRPRPLAITHLAVSCAPTPTAGGQALCLARDRDRSYLWSLAPDTGRHEPLATFHTELADLTVAGDHALIQSWSQPPLVWTPDRSLVALTLDDDCVVQTMTLTPMGVVGTLCWHEEGSELIVYRPLE